ncbi:MAG: hypothetical protein K0S32_778 [Bacteroidetes bacterium]|jgi:hypothetical protein|nr:hypothetical protein [Bacteroidota bacterium]
MTGIFDYVYRFLMFLSEKTGFTYFEINIICYYFIIPFFYAALIDRLYRFHYVKISFVVFVVVTLIAVKDFRNFSEKLFRLSQDFLLSFDFIGLDYVASSVVWCVIAPLLIFLFLFWLLRKKQKKMSTKFNTYENR